MTEADLVTVRLDTALARGACIDRQERQIVVVESSAIPTLDILFAFGPMIPFVLGAAAAWASSGSWTAIAVKTTAFWGGIILLFLAGVRRGLSFRTEGGPTWAQIATMLVLFCIGLGALVALSADMPVPALLLCLTGYVAILVLDPIAARCGEAPLFFVRLRRLQIPVALVLFGSVSRYCG